MSTVFFVFLFLSGLGLSLLFFSKSEYVLGYAGQSGDRFERETRSLLQKAAEFSADLQSRLQVSLGSVKFRASFPAQSCGTNPRRCVGTAKTVFLWWSALGFAVWRFSVRLVIAAIGAALQVL